MASKERSLGVVIGVIAYFLCIVLLVSLALNGFQGMSSLSLSSLSSSLKYRHNAHISLDTLNTMIKRRVPNGADPIHNRRGEVRTASWEGIVTAGEPLVAINNEAIVTAGEPLVAINNGLRG